MGIPPCVHPSPSSSLSRRQHVSQDRMREAIRSAVEAQGIAATPRSLSLRRLQASLDASASLWLTAHLYGCAYLSHSRVAPAEPIALPDRIRLFGLSSK